MKTPLWLAILQLVCVYYMYTWYVSGYNYWRFGEKDDNTKQDWRLTIVTTTIIVRTSARLPPGRNHYAAAIITYPDRHKRPIRPVNVFSDNKIRPGIRWLSLLDRQLHVVVDGFL